MLCAPRLIKIVQSLSLWEYFSYKYYKYLLHIYSRIHKIPSTNTCHAEKCVICATVIHIDPADNTSAAVCLHFIKKGKGSSIRRKVRHTFFVKSQQS